MATTQEVINQLIGYWGFTCQSGGRPYICPDMKHEFIGCCTVDPCTEERNGVCPDDNLRSTSFNIDLIGVLEAQGCDVSSSEALWYTCDYKPETNVASFAGCCALPTIPCHNSTIGCPAEDLRPAVLNNLGEWEHRDNLLNPHGSGISYNKTKAALISISSSISSTISPTSSSTSDPTSSSTNQPANSANDLNKSSGLSTGAIAGIAVGAVLAVLIIVAGILWKCGCFSKKKKAEETNQGADVPGAAMSHTGPMSPMAQQAYPQQGHPGYGYTDESGRSVISSPSTAYNRGKSQGFAILYFSLPSY